MAKTIKFNLICDGNPVRNIEDLQNNFCVEDVLGYFNNQLLHRWLKVRGYEEELDSVSRITDTEPINIIKELIKIFKVAVDEKDIEESIYIFTYQEEKKELYDIYKENDSKVKTIIDDYQTGYLQLVNSIISNKEDYPKIKAAITELLEEYYSIFQFNYRSLYYTLIDNAPMAIFVMLTFDKARKFYLPEDDVNYSDKTKQNRGFHDMVDMYKAACALTAKAEEVLGANLRTFSGETDSYWKDLEAKDKKYLILSMGNGDYVRSAGLTGQELNYENIKDEFVILDGIDYKSNYASHTLRYMEV